MFADRYDEDETINEDYKKEDEIRTAKYGENGAVKDDPRLSYSTLSDSDELVCDTNNIKIEDIVLEDAYKDLEVKQYYKNIEIEHDRNTEHNYYINISVDGQDEDTVTNRYYKTANEKTVVECNEKRIANADTRHSRHERHVNAPRDNNHIDFLFLCEICGKIFQNATILNKHRYNHGLSNQCDVCGKIFRAVGPLNSHKKLHSGERPYKCDICEKSFKLNGNLKLHKRIHWDVNMYECQICEKTFTQLSNLKMHVRSHSDERLYQCKICQKRFKYARCLKSHKTTNCNKCPYKCKICQNTFRRSSELLSHKKVHSRK